MSQIPYLLRSKPRVYYTFDGTSPRADRSGNFNPNLTISGYYSPVPTKSGPGAFVMSSTSTVTPVIRKTGVFSMYAEFNSPTQTSNIVSFNNTDDEGIWYASGRVYFAVAHQDTGRTTVSLDMDDKKMNSVLGVFDGTSVMIYSGDRSNSTQVTSSSPVVIGNNISVGDANVILSSVAYWDKAIGLKEYVSFTDRPYATMSRTGATTFFKGANLNLSSTVTDASIETIDESTQRLEEGVFFSEGLLVPKYVNELTLESQVTFSLSPADGNYGFFITWESQSNSTVEYSTNNTTWTTVTKNLVYEAGNSIVDGILIRVKFPAGVAERAYVQGLALGRNISGALYFENPVGRTLSYTGTLSLPVEADYRNYSSSTSTLAADMLMTIAADPDGNLSYGMDFWYTPSETDLTGTKNIVTDIFNLGISAGSLTFSSASAVYVNGTAATSGAYQLRADVPIHIYVKFATSGNTAIEVGDPTPVSGTISSLAVYGTDLNATDVQNLFNYQVGLSVTTVSGDSVNFGTETLTNSSHVWTTSGT